MRNTASLDQLETVVTAAGTSLASLEFAVERIYDVVLHGLGDLITKNLMSPFMWRETSDAGLMALCSPSRRTKGQMNRAAAYGIAGAAAMGWCSG